MYKYRCSKQDCGAVWTLQEGDISGFLVTCPVCGKGRGIYVTQLEKKVPEKDSFNKDILNMVVSVRQEVLESLDEFKERIEEFCINNSFMILETSLDSRDAEVNFLIRYKRLGNS